MSVTQMLANQIATWPSTGTKSAPMSAQAAISVPDSGGRTDHDRAARIRDTGADRLIKGRRLRSEGRT